MTDPSEPRTLAPSQIPPRRQSLLPSAFDDEVRFWKAKKPNLLRAGSSPNLPTLSEQLDEPASGSNAPLDGNGFQHHQSPSREPPPPPHAQSQQSHDSHQLPSILQPGPDTNHGSTSWLDNGDSGGSSASSLRSRSSSLYLRKRDRAVSGGTEAEFDAALDAAVEAAYDEGLEPMDGSDDMSADDDIVLNVRRNVERAKQKVREAELEAEAISAKERETRRVQNEAFQGNFTALDADYEDEEAEEEKLILEEMMDVFEFDVQSKSALPRQSGSSGYSGRTWGSSIGSNAATIGTSLSTLAEEDVFPSLDARLADSIPTTKPSLSALPTTAMPPPPPPLPPPPLPPPSTSDYNLDSDLPLLAPTTYTMPSDANSTQSVRARRLSGRDLTELSIETNTKLPPDAEPPKTVPASRTAAYPPPSPQSKDDLSTSQTNSWQSQGSQSAVLVQRLKSGHAASGSVESITAQSPVTSFPDLPVNEDGYETAHAISHRTVGKPVTTPDTMRKDTLSSHSKPLRAKVSSLPAEETSRVPESPFVSSFSASAGRKGPHASFSTSASASGVGGHFLFDGTLHSPMTPGYPNPSAPNAPDALEPCPQSFLLRPFWLLRCLYQTIAHPRGAYLTTKLFIPRDVWRVKNVKLKAIEEKISNCDLLTAALLKVAQVDTNDADAVLEEMQALESILDQVQAIWSKKLGSEVGVHGAMNLFKSSSDDSSHYGDQSSKSTSGGGKSYLTSWRKLRSKSSGPNAAPPSSGSKDSSKDTLTLNSLPMSETLNFRAPKRNVQELKCSGPNANYMHALARLCDAAQVVGEFKMLCFPLNNTPSLTTHSSRPNCSTG